MEPNHCANRGANNCERHPKILDEDKFYLPATQIQSQQMQPAMNQRQGATRTISSFTLATASRRKMPGAPSTPLSAWLASAGFSLLLSLCLACLLSWPHATAAQAISIRPADFERLIMPCYLGANGLNSNNNPGWPEAGLTAYNMGGPSSSAAYQQQQQQQLGGAGAAQFGRQNGAGSSGSQPGGLYGFAGQEGANGRPSANLQGPAPTSYMGPTGSQLSGGSPFGAGLVRDGLTNSLGQTVPRANTIDNFIALVTKIEVSNPRLANNPDQLIRALLGRFHLDNYYYDARSRTPISEQDRRYSDIVPALLSPQQQLQQTAYITGPDSFPELALDNDEKCSMYFMLSHFIDRSPTSGSLGQMPVQQLAGAQWGQRPPSLQAAGSGYPGQSANLAYSSGAAGSRYPGPTPGFGSPAMSNMNAFGSGVQSTNSDITGARSPYGVNTPANSQQQLNSLLSSSQLRNPNAAFPGAAARPPYIDGAARSPGRANQEGGNTNGAGVATEYGVVTLANQDNAALVLNRVLLGLLAASAPVQSIRQLASLIYPTQPLTPTPRLDDELDPLFAVTLADLWAVGATPKPGKPVDARLLGANGHWNDTMCPTSFVLERSNSIKFTTAELLGGLDGFNLGQLRRRLAQMRKNLKLSEMLRIYYSKNGFRPQLAEFGVCQRAMTLLLHQDELHRQAESYLRLYQLSSPMSDAQISQLIGRLESYREFARQAGQQFLPQDLCADSQSDLYPSGGQEECEIARADLVSVLDTSDQANQAFMELSVAKLAQRLGLSRDTNSLTIMTNQQDTSGYAGAYSFNSILRNCTNLAEVGCALTHDTTAGYQGGQVSDPTRLMEMFERALINLDSEYLTRQQAAGMAQATGYNANSNYNNNGRQSYVSTWFTSGGADTAGLYMPGGASGGPRNTGGAKVIVWFNYGQAARPAAAASGPTNWAPGQPYSSGSPASPSSLSLSSSGSFDQMEYKFYEAKKYLRENFRGASILAVSPNRDQVKAYVYDEQRDIFTDIPAGSPGSLGSTADYYPPTPADPGANALLAGPAEALAGKLLARMCTIPAIFQYPMCFRAPSSNERSLGYISPGRKQYWMMAPKTFFASRSVRLVFRVDGGRLRVCFGRKPNPDETAAANQQQQPSQQQQLQSYQPSAVAAFASDQGAGAAGAYGPQQPRPQLAPSSTTPPPQVSSSDYYTGLEYGVCKDVAVNQEIDFLVADPCWHKSIAECEPFYFVIREISQPGEGDPNYMCRESGCKRFDQAKFVMTHSGVTCSSASEGARASCLLVAMSLLSVALLTGGGRRRATAARRAPGAWLALALFASGYILLVGQQQARAQMQAGVYDFASDRRGERYGNLKPSEVLALVLVVMLILAGLVLTVGLCFYVTKRAARTSGTHTPVAQDEGEEEEEQEF